VHQLYSGAQPGSLTNDIELMLDYVVRYYAPKYQELAGSNEDYGRYSILRFETLLLHLTSTKRTLHFGGIDLKETKKTKSSQ
jgi:hypothetical protein